MQIYGNPAPGVDLGALIPGHFVMPQNPVVDEAGNVYGYARRTTQEKLAQQSAMGQGLSGCNCQSGNTAIKDSAGRDIVGTVSNVPLIVSSGSGGAVAVAPVEQGVNPLVWLFGLGAGAYLLSKVKGKGRR